MYSSVNLNWHPQGNEKQSNKTAEGGKQHRQQLQQHVVGQRLLHATEREERRLLRESGTVLLRCAAPLCIMLSHGRIIPVLLYHTSCAISCMLSSRLRWIISPCARPSDCSVAWQDNGSWSPLEFGLSVKGCLVSSDKLALCSVLNLCRSSAIVVSGATSFTRQTPARVRTRMIIVLSEEGSGLWTREVAAV